MLADRRAVRVVHGASDGVFPVAGHPVARLRASLVDAFNIPADAIALANGRRVPDGYPLRAGDVLEFVRERGAKGGDRNRITEDDLSALGFGVVGDQVVPIDAGPPDESWPTGRLEAYAKSRLSASAEAERQSILQAEKSAVELYWAGCALKFIRDQKKTERRGAWTAWRKEKGLAGSTVNDAIRLYLNAKTPDALAGLGITKAKEKFVYPAPDEGEDEDGVAPSPPPAKEARRSGARRPTLRLTTPDDDPAAGPVEGEASDVPPTEGDPTEATATELEEIAQRLNEIAQDDLGKADWRGPAASRLANAVQALDSAVRNIFTRANDDLPTA